VEGTKVVVAETERSIVGISVDGGKLLWKTPFPIPGRAYNSSTPVVEGQVLLWSGSGRGTRAVKLEKGGDGLTAKELWHNPDQSAQFNTPVLKDGLVYGLSDSDRLFCLDAKTGKTAWTAPLEGGGRRRGYGSIVDAGSVLMALTPRSELIVYEPSAKEFKQVAKYKVADRETFAYPVVVGNRIYVKDHDSLTLWTIE
jgi:outer membrane protein assembly factor BamB